MFSEEPLEQPDTQQEIHNLSEFFSLLWEIDRRVNPEHYAYSNRNTNSTD